MYTLTIVILALSVGAFFAVVILCVLSAFGILTRPVHRQMVNKMFKVAVPSLLAAVMGFIGISFKYLRFSARPYVGIMTDITNIQEALIGEKILKGSSCNTLGDETFRAIAEFQRRYGLPPTGAIDENTVHQLFHWENRPSSEINKLDQEQIHLHLREPPFDEMQIEVRRFQSVLKRNGCYSGEIDGIFKPSMEQPIAKFQRMKGLNADGVFGPATLLYAIQDDINGFYFMKGPSLPVPTNNEPNNAKLENPDRNPEESPFLLTDKSDCLCSRSISSLQAERMPRHAHFFDRQSDNP